MASTTEASRRAPGLSALDPDLALLASEAAIDIDNMLSKKETDLKQDIDLEAIHRLAELLSNSIDVNAGADALQSLMDPSTITVLNEAGVRSHEK